jgi:DNA-binding transcriptional ArsR family regulator
MDMAKVESLAFKLKVLGHPSRLAIAHGIAAKGCRVKQIAEDLGIPQSVASLHLSRLRAAGIVEGERQGSGVCYHVIDKTVLKLLELLPK